MIGREVQVIEVLHRRNGRVKTIVVGEVGSLQLTLYYTARDRYRVVWLHMKACTDFRSYGFWDVRPRIGLVRHIFDVDLIVACLRCLVSLGCKRLLRVSFNFLERELFLLLSSCGCWPSSASSA